MQAQAHGLYPDARVSALPGVERLGVHAVGPAEVGYRHGYFLFFEDKGPPAELT